MLATILSGIKRHCTIVNYSHLFRFSRWITSSFLAIWTIILVPVAISNTGSLAGSKELVAWKSIVSYLEWEKFWFGHFTGEECYKRLVNKQILVTFVFNTGGYGSRKCSYIDDHYEMEGSLTDVSIASIYIDQTAVKFSVVDTVKKPIAAIDLAETDQCATSALIRDSLNENLRKKGALVKREKLAIPNIDKIKLPIMKNDSRNNTVIDAVKRTMSALLYKEDNIKDTHSSSKNRRVIVNQELLVGRYRTEDPYLLVYYNGNRTIYVLDFPSLDILKDRNACLLMRNQFRLDHPQGEDERQFFDSFYNHLRNNSIKIRF